MLGDRLIVQRVLRREARITGTAIGQVTQRHDAADTGGPDTTVDRLRQRVQHRLLHTLSCRSAGK